MPKCTCPSCHPERSEAKSRDRRIRYDWVAIQLYHDAVKARLLREGLIRNQCDECGLTEWRGKALIVHIDHVNGVRDDHRLENLRMLCPNCHSQTDTYGARDKRRWSLQERPRPV
jgi:5-methylcytosine-specific restriction endonuclease McrA